MFTETNLSQIVCTGRTACPHCPPGAPASQLDPQLLYRKSELVPPQSLHFISIQFQDTTQSSDNLVILKKQYHRFGRGPPSVAGIPTYMVMLVLKGRMHLCLIHWLTSESWCHRSEQWSDCVTIAPSTLPFGGLVCLSCGTAGSLTKSSGDRGHLLHWRFLLQLGSAVGLTQSSGAKDPETEVPRHWCVRARSGPSCAGRVLALL